MGFVLIFEDGFLCSMALGLSMGSHGSVRASLPYGLLYHTTSFLSSHIILALQDDPGPRQCGYLLQFPGARKHAIGLCGGFCCKVPRLIGTLG